MKPIRLKIIQLKSIKEHFRKYLPKNCYEQTAQLFSHLVWQDDEILRLTRDLRERTELDLFEKPLLAPRTALQPSAPPIQVDDRKTRLEAILADPVALRGYLAMHPSLTKELIEAEVRSHANIALDR